MSILPPESSSIISHGNFPTSTGVEACCCDHRLKLRIYAMESSGQQQLNRFVVEFISATDIPWFENRVKSDPSIQAYISTHVEKQDSNNRPVFHLQRAGNTITTPRRLDCTSVIWHCYRDFNTKPTAESILTIEIYHQGSHLLGKVDIPTRVLSHENPMTFPFYTAKVCRFYHRVPFSCVV